MEAFRFCGLYTQTGKSKIDLAILRLEKLKSYLHFDCKNIEVML